MLKVSFIVPVYNVENYLKSCLDSLINQDLEKNEYEIVCVNDGSTDGSLEILNEYAESNINIRVVTQENKGVTYTRNKGVLEASGEYVWFVDSDDFIAYNCLSTIYKVAKMQNLDQLYFNKVNISQEQTTINTFAKDKDINESIIQSKDVFKKDGEYVFCSIIKRDVLIQNNIKFVENVFVFEEFAFNLQLKQFCKKIKKLEREIYFYRVFRKDGVTATYKNRIKEYIDSRINLANWYYRTIKQYKKDKSASSYVKELKKQKMFDTQGALALTVSLGDKNYTKEIVNKVKKLGLYPYNSLPNLIPTKSIKETLKRYVYFFFPIRAYLYFITFVFKIKNRCKKIN